MPAHDHQVGTDGQADQGPGRVAGHDLLTDRDAGYLSAQLSISSASRVPAAAVAGPGPGRAWIAITVALRRLASSFTLVLPMTLLVLFGVVLVVLSYREVVLVYTRG